MKKPIYLDKIRSNSLFTGHNLRKAVNDGRSSVFRISVFKIYAQNLFPESKFISLGTADFNSCFLHEVPLLFRRGVIKLNVALVHVSEPDANGFCSLGTSVDTARAAVANAKYIVAMTNKNMPRTFGDGLIHASHFDAIVKANDFQLHTRKIGSIGEVEQKIGEIIANELVDNGATLQMGKSMFDRIFSVATNFLKSIEFLW